MTAPDSTLPRIDVCVEIYLDAWELFGTQSFEPNESQRQLDLLVAYGLFERTGDGRYRIRCVPGTSVERWQHDVRPQLETVHQRIHRSKQRSGDRHDETVPRVALVWHEGETYVRTDLAEDATFREIQAELPELMDHSDAAGVVLQASAILTGEVQQLADRLCSAEAMADADCPRFEKVDSGVAGEHKDDLEYRLYLRAVC